MRPFSFDHPAPGFRVEGVGAEADHAEQRARDEGRVCTVGGLLQCTQDELGLAQAGDDRLGQPRRVGRQLALQRGQLAAGVGQHDTQGDLAGVREVGHAERVTDLEVEVEGPLLGETPGAAYAVEVAVDPVHRHAGDREPPATVDPRTPLARPGHPRPVGTGAGFGQRLGHLLQALDVERRAVVETEIHVGVRVLRPTRPASAQHHRHHTRYVRQAFGDLPQLLVRQHRLIFGLTGDHRHVGVFGHLGAVATVRRMTIQRLENLGVVVDDLAAATIVMLAEELG
jgi:hypothetical protein